MLLGLVLAGCNADGLTTEDAPPPGSWVKQTWQFANGCGRDANVGLKTADATIAGSVAPAGQTFQLETYCTVGNRICGTSDGTVLSCFDCAAGVLPALAVPCR